MRGPLPRLRSGFQPTREPTGFQPVERQFAVQLTRRRRHLLLLSGHARMLRRVAMPLFHLGWPGGASRKDPPRLRCRRRPIRPFVVELLEGRLVLATFTVTT